MSRYISRSVVLNSSIGQNKKDNLTKAPLPLDSRCKRVRWASFWMTGLSPKGVWATGTEKRLRHWTTRSPFLSILSVAESFAFCTTEILSISIASAESTKTRESARTVKGVSRRVEIRTREKHLANEIIWLLCRFLISATLYQAE